jgi:hypothetical protein
LQTSSPLLERLGSQVPTILHSPPDVASLASAEECIQLADAYGVCDGYPLAESQKITLRNGLGERADGSWAATRIADFGPRQGTGKNDKIAARELAGLILFGEELIIHTAHEFPTANESFLRLVAVFEAWDDLRRKVSRIRYANGEQGIELLSGQRLKYRARTGGSGRGFAKADLIVYDEAQHLSREHIAASGPAKLANPNSQTWYAGSGGLSTSVVAWSIRKAAMAGDAGRLAYTEMTAEYVQAPDGSLVAVEVDPLDVDSWYRCIPGLGRWVTEEGVMALQGELQELFPREVLCIWEPDPGSEATVIPLEQWDSMEDKASESSGRTCLALDVSPDRKWASICEAGRRDDGLIHLEVVDRRPSTGWVVDALPGLLVKAGCESIRIEKGGPAASLISQLTEAGVTVDEVSAADHARATGQIIDFALAGQLRHLGQQTLRSAVAGATLRASGDAELWSRRSSKVDVSPLVACTLALGGVPEVSATVEPNFYSLDDFLTDD